MTSLESMINKLAPLRLYNLKDDSVVYAELAAFGAGLDILRAKLSELERESFIPTAQSYGIETYEKLTGNVRNELTIEKRREMLISRYSMGYGDFTLKGFEKMLKLVGVDGEIEESPLCNRIIVKAESKEYTAHEKSWIVWQINSMIPAHLDCDVVFDGFSWKNIDASGNTFAQNDARNLRWKEIDYIV